MYAPVLTHKCDELIYKCSMMCLIFSVFIAVRTAISVIYSCHEHLRGDKICNIFDFDSN